MKNPIPIGAVIGAVAVLLALVTFAYVKGTGSEGGPTTANDRQLIDALGKAGGNPQRLDPETRRLYEQRVTNNPMSTANRYGANAHVPGSTQAGAPPR